MQNRKFTLIELPERYSEKNEATKGGYSPALSAGEAVQLHLN